VDYVDTGDMLGVAPSLFGEEWPITGVRHLAAKGTCGWYIWTGEYSTDPHFFEPHHVGHVLSARSEVAAYLGLPPGWGFIIAPGYEDIWRDESLLVE
jgi:hypothetical protein